MPEISHYKFIACLSYQVLYLWALASKMDISVIIKLIMLLLIFLIIKFSKLV